MIIKSLSLKRKTKKIMLNYFTTIFYLDNLILDCFVLVNLLIFSFLNKIVYNNILFRKLHFKRFTRTKQSEELVLHEIEHKLTK